jgi:tRNA A-37 threonylcarbamoyl transferase component Bud32
MPLKEGENVGAYRIIGQLGQGGMATVYRAYHPLLDRYVAIKMMHQAFLEDPTFHARFEREAQIVARLEHPNIIPIYDYSFHQEQPYLVMKFVEGKTLKGTLVDGALTLEQVITMITAVASALSYAHERGVLHRDIKPSNVVIANDGTPYLTDFGLARIAERGESTMSGDMVLGTPHYMSPEQAMGKKDLDNRTDIYSLGVVLYELVVGRVPFSADTPYAIIHDHIYSPLPLPSVVNPDIPPRVEQVLLKALSKEAEARYGTANELANAFKQAIGDSGMKDLNANRASIAGVSLAKMREQRTISGLGTPPPAPAAIPVPRGSTAVGLPPSEASLKLARKRKGARRFWTGFGCLVFIVSCGLCTVSSLGALGTLQEQFAVLQYVNETNVALGTPQGPPRPARPTREQPPVSVGMATARATTEATSEVAAAALEVTPEAAATLEVAAATSDNLQSGLSVPDAAELVRANDTDPNAYLSLAEAYWRADELSFAQQTIEQGAEYTESLPDYVWAASQAATRAEQHEISLILALVSLNYAEESGDAEVLATARERVGAHVYELMTGDLLSGDFGAMIGELAPEVRAQMPDQSYIAIMTAARMLQNGRPRLAEGPLREIEDTPYQAELNLVRGQIDIATRRRIQALESWQAVIDDPDAPQWAVERAEALIDQHS